MPEIFIPILTAAGALVAFVAVRNGALHWGAAVALVAALLVLIREAFLLADAWGMSDSREEPRHPPRVWRRLRRR